MKPSIDIGDITRKTRHSYFQDGLLDILLGIQLLLVYLAIEYNMWANVLWLVLGLVIIEVIRKRITYPRIGYARMANQGATAARIIGLCILGIILLSVVMALVFLFLGLPVQNNWGNVIKIAAVLFIPVIFGLLAYEHKAYRWLAYGVLIGLGGLSVMLIAPRVIQFFFVILGGIITVIGIKLFTDFLKKYPRPPEEATDAG